MSSLPFPVRIALVYLAVGCVWIVGTDWLVVALADPALVPRLQTYKGWLFVALSAVLIFELARRHLQVAAQEEARIRGLQAELQTAQEVAGVGHLSLDPGTGEVHGSGELTRIFGVGGDDMASDYEGVLEIVHPDDRTALKKAVDQALETEEAVDLTLRVQRPSGAIRWVRMRILLVYNGQRKRQELIGTFQDVTEATLAEGRLRASESRLQALSTHLQEAREEERRRLSMDIHDEIGGNLAGIRMTLARLVDETSSEAAEVRELASRMDQSLEDTVRTVRSLAREMRPGILDELGLAAAIEWLASDVRGYFEGTVALNLESEEFIDLPPKRGIHVFRIAHEAITNALRHGDPENIRILLCGKEDRMILRVRDDGSGFEANGEAQGMGQLNMQERAYILDASLEFRSTPGQGTVVELTVPRAVSASAEIR